MDVSIIIVNYNTSALINDAIDSIFRETSGISYEIIVVDNATENLSQKLRAYGNPKVKTIQLSENIGFGRANNEALKMASGRNILFLNPDTKVLNNAIAILCHYLDNHPDCGACGANLYDGNMKPARSFRKVFPTVASLILDTLLLGKYEKIRVRKDLQFNSTGKPCKVAYIVGADLMCRASVIGKHGAFNPGFFMYYEEIEMCNRLHKAGYNIMSVPEAKIQHLEGKSGVIGERYAAIHYNSADTYRKLTLTHNKYRLYRQVLPLIIISRITLGKIAGRTNTVRFWEQWKKLYRNSKTSTVHDKDS